MHFFGQADLYNALQPDGHVMQMPYVTTAPSKGSLRSGSCCLWVKQGSSNTRGYVCTAHKIALNRASTQIKNCNYIKIHKVE
jgi:hypothetical protein